MKRLLVQTTKPQTILNNTRPTALERSVAETTRKITLLSLSTNLQSFAQFNKSFFLLETGDIAKIQKTLLKSAFELSEKSGRVEL